MGCTSKASCLWLEWLSCPGLAAVNKCANDTSKHIYHQSLMTALRLDFHPDIHTVGPKIGIGAWTVSHGTNGSLALLLDLGLWTGLKCHWIMSVGLLIEACVYVCHYGSLAPLQAWEHSVTDGSGGLYVQVQSVTWSRSPWPAEPLLSSHSQLMLQPRPTRCEYPQ